MGLQEELAQEVQKIRSKKDLIKWCEDNGFRYNNNISFKEAKEDVIVQIFKIIFDPAPSGQWIEEI